MPASSSEEDFEASIKDHNDQSRWTWRYKLHKDQILFDRAYSYIKEYY